MNKPNVSIDGVPAKVRRVYPPLVPEARVAVWLSMVVFVLSMIAWLWSEDWRVAVSGLAMSLLVLFTAAMINQKTEG